ncbi:MAG: two-component regulator propeller domain-containing protein, partial [Bacteroidales bacterium]
MRRFLVCLFISYSALYSMAQIIPFHNYTVKNGLPANFISDIEQDHWGYIWLATQVGAVKFDGYNFITYTIEDGLPDKHILDIFIDSRNKVWFATSGGGLSCMEKNRIRYVMNQSSGKTDDLYIKVFEDKKGYIWYIANDVFSVITPDTIMRFDHSNSPIVSEILCTHVAFDGTVWLTTVEGVYYYDTELHIYDQPELEQLIVRDIKEDKPGSFWFATQEKGVFHFEKEKLIRQYNSSNGLNSNVSLS